MQSDTPDQPALSIIVPMVNEVATLPRLFASLAMQGGVAFELILVDGQSSDGSLQRAEELAGHAPFPCRIVGGRRGRGRQLNTGVALSYAETLLFLHADSRFASDRALAGGLRVLKEAIAAGGHDRVAGHYSLRFSPVASAPAFGYFFLEAKARTGRPGSIHGDQGYLMRRAFFDLVGPFDETLGFLEDNRLAQAVRARGCWLLLPFELITSARRFEQEGFARRQMLNGLIMTLDAVGGDDLLQEMPGIYRQQSDAQQLQLVPFYRGIARQLRSRRGRERMVFWYRIGRYLVGNAWQLAFWWDVLQAFRRGAEPGAGAPRLLDWFERRLLWLLDHPAGYAAAAFAAWCWFRVQLVAGWRVS